MVSATIPLYYNCTAGPLSQRVLAWLSANTLDSLDVVAVCWACLVLGWIIMTTANIFIRLIINVIYPVNLSISTKKTKHRNIQITVTVIVMTTKMTNLMTTTTTQHGNNRQVYQTTRSAPMISWTWYTMPSLATRGNFRCNRSCKKQVHTHMHTDTLCLDIKHATSTVTKTSNSKGDN